MKKTLLILLLLLVVIAITKPSENSFESYISTQLNSNNKYSFITKIIKVVPKGNINLQTNYIDRIFFSVGETIVGSEKHKFLGLVGFWIFLS